MELTPELQDRLEAYVKGELPFNELAEMESIIESNPELQEMAELLNGLEVISIEDRLALIYHELEEENAFDNEDFDEIDAEIESLFFTHDEIDAEIETLVEDLFSAKNVPSDQPVEDTDDSTSQNQAEEPNDSSMDDANDDLDN